MVNDLIKIGKALLSIAIGLLVGLVIAMSESPRGELGCAICGMLAIYCWIFSDANADVASRLVFCARNLCIFGLPIAAIIWLVPVAKVWILGILLWSFPLLMFVGWVLGPHDNGHGDKATHLRGRSQTSMGSDPIALRRKQRQLLRQCQARVDEDESHV